VNQLDLLSMSPSLDFVFVRVRAAVGINVILDVSGIIAPTPMPLNCQRCEADLMSTENENKATI
jgi:hypothetical protein